MPHGSGIYVRRLLDALRRSGVGDHELWVLPEGGPGPEVIWEQVVLPRALRRREAALVHGPDSFLPLRRSCPGVVTVHDLAFEAMPRDMPRLTQVKYKTLARRAAVSAELVICPSSFTADDVERRYRVPRERLRVIPLAPALPDGAALPAGAGEPAGGPYLLAAGDLRPKKNLAVLIDAFRRLHRDGLPHRLILAGADFGQAAALARLAQGAPVEIAGFVDDAALDALLRGADALVVPGVYEGFGLVALDAMARGCPVVLARAGALPETGGAAAAYFDPADAQELADVLGALLGDGPERERLGAAGRSHAAGFSWEATAAATVAVYEELL